MRCELRRSAVSPSAGNTVNLQFIFCQLDREQEYDTHTHMHTKIKINKNESAHMLVFQQILKTKLVYKKKDKTNS